MPENNPLRDLVEDGGFDREFLASELRDLLAIHEDSGELIFKGPYQRMSAKEKILLYLLGKKVQYDLGMVDSDYAGPAEIAEELDMNSNTVRSALSRGIGTVFKDSRSSEYRIPDHSVEEAVNMIK